MYRRDYDMGGPGEIFIIMVVVAFVAEVVRFSIRITAIILGICACIGLTVLAITAIEEGMQKMIAKIKEKKAEKIESCK